MLNIWVEAWCGSLNRSDEKRQGAVVAFVLCTVFLWPGEVSRVEMLRCSPRRVQDQFGQGPMPPTEVWPQLGNLEMHVFLSCT